MLHVWRHPQAGELRLYVRLTASPAGLAPAEAWISQDRAQGYRNGPDWVLWVRRGNVYTCARCQQTLELETRLRAWLLWGYRRRLYDLSFEDLCGLARQEGGIRRRIRA